MRGAVIVTLKALYEGKKITANSMKECNTTRVSNEIGTLKNKLDIDIIMERVNTENHKWYGRYHLVRTKGNLERVIRILEIHSKQDEVQES